MRKLIALASVAFILFTAVAFLLSEAPPAAADCTECKQIECSGRQINCGDKDPVSKVTCEVNKSKWKANCEAKKKACEAVEGKF
jgi:hypothetical protein